MKTNEKVKNCLHTWQVLDYLEETIKAAPETLGDVHKESADEMAERHVRVLSQALLALASFLDLLIPLPDSAATPVQPRVKGQTASTYFILF